MSMTREEAIKALHLEGGLEISGNARRLSEFMQGLDVALTALRGPTREMVEKMRGEWQPIERLWKYSHQWQCTKCGHPTLTNKKNFCENCGAPMTDEAVDMMLERLEAFK